MQAPVPVMRALTATPCAWQASTRRLSGESVYLEIAALRAFYKFAESEKLLQRAETVSRVGGFMLDFASGELQWTAQTYRIHEIDERRAPDPAWTDSFSATCSP